MKETLVAAMSDSLEPICCRDDHHMKFEKNGITWKAMPDDHEMQAAPSYHCSYNGCSVRYDLERGYFTVVNTPEHPFFVEEPGVNLLMCPKHGTWLYRKESDNCDERYEWHCGAEDCDYVHKR
jgi:hypothetical protein